MAEEVKAALREGIRTANPPKDTSKAAIITTEPAEKAKRVGKAQVEVQPILTGLTTSNAPGNDHTTMSDYEQGQLIFMKTDQERIRLAKTTADLVKQKD